jgi:hypothetical protein
MLSSGPFDIFISVWLNAPVAAEDILRLAGRGFF